LVAGSFTSSQAHAKSPFLSKESRFSFYSQEINTCEKGNGYVPEIKTRSFATMVYSEQFKTNNEILNCLMMLESSGIETKVNPRDTDGKPRYGLLQYSIETWNEWCVNKYHLPDEIYNGNVQLECATRMIFEDNQGRRWPPLKKCM